MLSTDQVSQECKRLLIIDDDSGIIEYLTEILATKGYKVSGETDPQCALRRLETESFDLLISDVEMPGLRGLDLMRAIHAKKPGQLILLMTAFGSIDLGVLSLQTGACGFVIKPFYMDDLINAIDRAFRDREMRREIVRISTPEENIISKELVAESPNMQKILPLAKRAAQVDLAVLLTGESGVGKGAQARFIHEHSSRCNGAFLQINCAALPFTLVESELFGVCKGAYTDARENRPGLFVEAMRWIRAYAWPGNVRELANTLERAVALTEHDTILLEDLAHATQLQADDNLLNRLSNQPMSLANMEITYIHRVLEMAQGNKAQAAKILGID